MKKVLLNFFNFTVVCSFIFASVPGSAKIPAKKYFNPLCRETLHPSSFFSVKKINRPITVLLAITAPGDLHLNTDPSLNVATNVLLGTPIVLADSNTNYIITNDAPTNYPIGITSVSWTVTDDKGNTATATQTVTVTDNEKPFISQMFEISVVNDPGQCGAVVQLIIPETYDNSGGPVTITSNAPSYFQVGSVTITWTATDMYGNSNTSDQVITVIDNELPMISTTNIQVNNIPGQCGAVVDLGTPLTSDNCGVVSITNDAPAFFPVGTTLVHWVVADKVGYTNTSTQTVVVTDTEKPVITSPAVLTVNNTAGKCGAILILTAPAVSDNCGVAGITNNAPALFPTGTTIVTWTATDNSGNISTATQSILVKDVEAPVFSGVPANATVTCSSIPAVTAPDVTDNCTASPTITFSQVSTQGTDVTKTAYYNYTITRTWTAKDAANNSSTATQVITVQDKTAPVITVPSNISVSNAVNVCGAVVNYIVTASDNCGSPVTLAYSKASGSSFSIGTTTVTVTAKDVSGNTSTKSFTITVTDIQKPTVKAPSNITVTAGSNNMAGNVNLGTPVTSDNCGVASVTNNAPSMYAVGTTMVTWTVKDVHNNVATAIQTVTVNSRKKSNELSPVQLNNIKTEKAFAEEGSLAVIVAPNPSPTYFTLKLESRYDTPIGLRVTDATGKVIDTRSKLTANSNVQIGHRYIPGIYFAEITQGAERKIIQLMKVK